MRVWGIVRRDHRIERDAVMEFSFVPPLDADEITELAGVFAHEFDLARPVVLSKHVKELRDFGHTAFRPGDFMEPVTFDRFELEIFSEKKKEEKGR